MEQDVTTWGIGMRTIRQARDNIGPAAYHVGEPCTPGLSANCIIIPPGLARVPRRCELHQGAPPRLVSSAVHLSFHLFLNPGCPSPGGNCKSYDERRDGSRTTAQLVRRLFTARLYKTRSMIILRVIVFVAEGEKTGVGEETDLAEGRLIHSRVQSAGEELNAQQNEGLEPKVADIPIGQRALASGESGDS